MDSDFRDALREVDFESLTKQWRDTPFRLLIQEHVRETDGLLESAIAGIVNGLCESELEAIRQLFEHYQMQASQNCFWRDASATQVLLDSVEMLTDTFQEQGIVPEKKVLFAGFQFVTMNFAGIARESKPFRKAIGIRKGFFCR